MTSTTIESLRTEIDELDAELIRLINARLALSRTIQAERLASGGPRVVLAREGAVVSRWHAALGSPGSRIARTLLELSRGPATGA
ncbi:MAG: chorismate mutase [Actinomycetota bacterium]|nr:chorismate mutase [Actinomycetota bacterium]